MLHPLWYTLLATYISAHTVFLPMRPLEQPGIVIRADCFNINPCPDRNGNRWTLLKSAFVLFKQLLLIFYSYIIRLFLGYFCSPSFPGSWPATTTKFRVSRLKIRTRYINDLTASSSLSSTSATTPAPPPPSILTTLISSPASATTTINTAARITDSTPSINTVITAENTEPQSPLTTVTSENPSSPSINTTNAEQYTPRLEKAPSLWYWNDFVTQIIDMNINPCRNRDLLLFGCGLPLKEALSSSSAYSLARKTTRRRLPTTKVFPPLEDLTRVLFHKTMKKPSNLPSTLF